MTFANINGIRLHYRVDGTQRSDAPWLVLANALGADVTMWSPQIAAFSARFRVLRFDTRGLGCSDAPPGPYTVEQWTGTYSACSIDSQSSGPIFADCR